jgi:hypothetical protein
MFRVQRGGDYRQTHNHNDAPAMIKVLGFLFVVGLVGGVIYALVATLNAVTTGIGRSWQASNNDTLLGTVNTVAIMVTVALLLVFVGTVVPWLIRNWMQALTPPTQPRGGGYRVLPGQQPMLDTPNYGLLDEHTGGWPEVKMLDVDYSEVAKQDEF